MPGEMIEEIYGRYQRSVKEMVNDSILGWLYFISNEIKVTFSLFFIDLSPGFVYIIFQC